MYSAFIASHIRFAASGYFEFRAGVTWYRADVSERDVEEIIEREMPQEIAASVRWADGTPTLYAFSDGARRDMFDALCEVQGIGPSSALLIVGLGDTHHVLLGVASGDSDFFCQVPGIGPGRAGAVIDQLGRRVGPLPAPLTVPTVAYVHALETLDACGLSAFEADLTVRAVIDAGDPQQLRDPELLCRAVRDAVGSR